jgi:uncharacterized RDD family membrane protein YckC
MNWYYSDGGKQSGPVDDAGLDNLIRIGVVRPETLVWREGLSGWQALSAARPTPAAAPAPAPAPAAPAYQAPQPSYQQPQQPAYQQPQQPAYQAPQPQQPAYQQPQPAYQAPQPQSYQQPQQPFQPQAQPQGPFGYQPQGQFGQQAGQAANQASAAFSQAGDGLQSAIGPLPTGPRFGNFTLANFWVRFGARIIDGILIGIVAGIINFVIGMIFGIIIRTSGSGLIAMILPILSLLVQVCVGGFYEGYFLSNKNGQTLGKQLLKIRVIMADGSPLTFQKGFIRYACTMLSGIILAIGYIIALFDPEVRALHDRLVGTRVVVA